MEYLDQLGRTSKAAHQIAKEAARQIVKDARAARQSRSKADIALEERLEQTDEASVAEALVEAMLAANPAPLAPGLSCWVKRAVHNRMH